MENTKPLKTAKGIPAGFSDLEYFKRQINAQDSVPTDIVPIRATLSGSIRVINNAVSIINNCNAPLPAEILKYLSYVGDDRDVFIELVYSAAREAFESIEFFNEYAGIASTLSGTHVIQPPRHPSYS